MAVKAVRERLSTLQQALVTEADVLDRAFAVSVGTRELYDTILDPSRTVELYTSLGSTNIRVAAWSKPEPITGVQFFATDKPEIALPTDTFEMRSRPLQRYRADASNGGSYLVSSMEYLVLNTPETPSPTTQPRMFILFRISQTPTQQYGDIMQLHEYITFYRAGRESTADGIKAADRGRLRAADRASYARTIVNYRPSIEYEGSKPVLHHLIKRIAIPSMRKSFADWVKALGPLAAQFRRHLMDLALKEHAKKEAEAAAELERTKQMQEASQRRARGEPDQDASDDDDDASSDDDTAGAASSGGRRRSRSHDKRGGGSDAAVEAGKSTGPGGAAAGKSIGPGGAAGSLRSMMAASKAASKLKVRAKSLRRLRTKRMTAEERDAKRFGQLSDKLRSDADGYTSEIRRMVFDHVSSRGADATKHRKVPVTTDDEADTDADNADDEDPSATAGGFDGAEWGTGLASKGDEFGVLDGFEFRRKAAGRDRCHLVLEQVGDEDLAARFWAQTFSRDCSIWPGAFAGDSTAKTALDSFMVPMADPADMEGDDDGDDPGTGADATSDTDADGELALPSPAVSVGGQAVSVPETPDEARGFGSTPATARPSLFDYMRAGLTLSPGDPATTTSTARSASQRASSPQANSGAKGPVDPSLAAEAHAELLAGVLQSLRLGAGSALPSDVKAMVFGGPQQGRAAAEAARNRRVAFSALDASPTRPTAPQTDDEEAHADRRGRTSSAMAESKDSADDGLSDDGKAAALPVLVSNSADSVAPDDDAHEAPTELSRILQAVDVLPPKQSTKALAASKQSDLPPGHRFPGASSGRPTSERLSAWLHDRQGALDDSPPSSERAAFASRPASPVGDADGYASADSGGYLTEMERGGDFKPLGGGAGGAFDPSKAMTPLEALAAREQPAADMAPKADPSSTSGSGSHRGDCTPADLPCCVM